MPEPVEKVENESQEPVKKENFDHKEFHGLADAALEREN